MKRETLFLKAVLFLMVLPVLALCMFAVPGIGREVADYYPEAAVWRIPAFIGWYASAIAYFAVLYQAFRLLCYIDKNNAFSELSVKSLKNIKYCAIAISIFNTASMPLVFLIAEKDDAPGLILIGGAVLIGASLVIAFFAAVLQKLLRNAIDIKSENDLTV